MRRLIIPIILSLGLGACALNSGNAAASEPGTRDLSQPSLASIYHYLCGSFASFSDLPTAEAHFQRAFASDPNSPQIKRELLRTKINLHRYGQIPDSEFVEILRLVRDDQDLEIEELSYLLSFYDAYDDQEGKDWVLRQLESKTDDPISMYVLYAHNYRMSGKADTKKIARILDAAEDKKPIAYALASHHLEKDPQISKELLQIYGNDVKSKELMLDTLIGLEDFTQISKLFAEYQYPEDAMIMKFSMDRMRNIKRADLIIPHSQKILDTNDKYLIAMLAELVYYAEDIPVITSISDYLLRGTFEPQMDTQIAPILISYAIIHPESNLPLDDLNQRVSSFNSAITIPLRYLYFRSPESVEAAQTAQVDFQNRVQECITDPALKNLLLAADLINPQNYATEAAFNFVLHQANRDVAPKEDFEFAISYAFANDRRQEVIPLLRKAMQNYPNESQFMNDLGYFLLDNPEHWEEAERLIAKALILEPEQASYNDSMAWLLYLKGNYSEAASYIPKIIQGELLNTLHPELLYHIGMIQIANGEVDAARICLEAIEDSENEFRIKLADALNAK